MKDHLGSTRSVIDDNQNTVAEQTMYDSYGKLDSITVTEADPAREKFTGKEFDSDGADDENITKGMKLFYFGARYYDAEVGVWMSTDPREQFHGLYTYAGNGFNPVNSIDPDGEALISGTTIVVITGITIFGVAIKRLYDGWSKKVEPQIKKTDEAYDQYTKDLYSDDPANNIIKNNSDMKRKKEHHNLGKTVVKEIGGNTPGTTFTGPVGLSTDDLLMGEVTTQTYNAVVQEQYIKKLKEQKEKKTDE